MVPSMPLLILRMQPSLIVRNQMCSVRTLNLLFLAPVFNTSRTDDHVSRKTLHRDTFTFPKVQYFFRQNAWEFGKRNLRGGLDPQHPLSSVRPRSERSTYVQDYHFEIFYFRISLYRWKGSSRMKKQGKGLAWRWLLARTLHPFRYCPFVCFLLLACLFVCFFWLVCLACRGS